MSPFNYYQFIRVKIKNIFTNQKSFLRFSVSGFLFGAMLIAILSCATAQKDSFSEPMVLAEEHNTNRLSDSPLMSDQPMKANKDLFLQPQRPFPDFPPNYLQFPPQWFIDDYNNGTLFVGEDNIASNYQAWHEFISKINRGMNSSLYIQTFTIDTSKEVNDSTRYHKAARYYLTVLENQATWRDLSNDNIEIKGNLSIMYDAQTGLHEVFIKEDKVFEFVYFQYDPGQCALFFGYTPIDDLPETYSIEDAISDGCLVIKNNEIQNSEVIDKYNDLHNQADYVGRFIRIYFKDYRGVKIMDIGTYNERTYITVDYSRCSQYSSSEVTFVTTYYDNAWVTALYENDTYTLDVGFEFRDTMFIFKDLPYKNNKD